MALVPVFDLDGTLIDSDEALVAPFLLLGVEREAITFGHTLDVECARLGISVDAYLDAYDDQVAQPFGGVRELVAGLDRWAVCSNKHAWAGHAELARLGWEPEVALFSDAFDGPKRLGPVLDALGLCADQILFVGDTTHDRQCALDVSARFALAGWNPRADPAPGDLVLADPGELPGHLDGQSALTA
jgi:phosphoglycolate phosphatase-like HAD superfamily hydrolase